MCPRLILASTLSGLMMIGCSTQGVTRDGGLPQLSQGNDTGVTSANAQPYLYVGTWDSVAVYALGGSKPLRVIKRSYCANKLAFDPSGDLYVLCGAIDAGQIAQYAAGTSKILRTFNGEGVPSIGVDRNGYFYMAAGDAVWVYPPKGTTIWHRIRKFMHGPSALLFGPDGEFYAAHDLGVGVFGPGSPGKPKLLREIRSGVRAPRALALDKSGDLFVANCLTCIYNDRRDTITVYAKGGSEPVQKIWKSVKTPSAIAVDSKGRLYVANVDVTRGGFHSGWVSVYASGATMPLRKVTNGINVPVGIAIDPDDNLYVANSYGTSVTVYAPGGAKLLRKITDGASYPQSLAFSAYR